MRASATSSLFIPTLASSTSLATMVAAAPTDGQDVSSLAARQDLGPGDLINGDLLGGDMVGDAGGLGNNAVGRRDELETRQLGPVLDTVAQLVPIIDVVLSLLGLRRASTIPTAAETPALSSDEYEQIKKLVSDMATVPLVGGGPVGAPNGSTDTSNNDTDTNHQNPKRIWLQRSDLPAGVVQNPRPAARDVAAASSTTGSGSCPTGTSAYGAADNGNATTSASPFSPTMPPNPPNSPAAAASLPPMFAEAGFNYTNCDGTETYPATPSSTA